MSDPIPVIDVVVEIETKLSTAIDSSPKSLAPQLATVFKAFQQQAATWMKDAKSIVVTDATQKAAMKKASEFRKELKKVRCAAEEKRKEMKSDALLYGRAIDSVAGVVIDGIKPIEEYLQLQEDFAELQELKRKSALIESRGKQLATIGVNPAPYQLGEMTEEAFGDLLVGLKVAKEQAAERARVAEAQRVEELKRIESQRAENARIRQEAAHVQKVAAEAQHLLLDKERLMAKVQADNAALRSELASAQAKIQPAPAPRPVVRSTGSTPQSRDAKRIDDWLAQVAAIAMPAGMETAGGKAIEAFLDKSFTKLEADLFTMKKGIK